MADVFTSQTEDFDGSASPITATGSITLAFNGDVKGAELSIWARVSANADYQVIYQSKTHFFVPVVLPAGATWYATLTGTTENTDCNLAYLDI